MNPHIKGPWEATPALSNSWDIRDSGGRQMYFLGAGSSISKEVHKANALLIAAAPELLDALKEMLYQLDGPGLLPDQKDACLKAHDVIYNLEGAQ